MSSNGKEVVQQILPFYKIYSDGYVERLIGSHYVPPSLDDLETGVSSKDITISENPFVSARLYLPKLSQLNQKLPVLIYFHGGAFCIESAFSFFHQRFLNRLVSEAQVVAVSVEYRLAPEHPLPAAYEDSWFALQWVASHANTAPDQNDEIQREPWLSDNGNFTRVYIAGDSAGGNIVNHILMKTSSESLPGCVRIFGAMITHPFFWGSKPVLSEPAEGHEEHILRKIWESVYPSAPGGVDNPLINPVIDGAHTFASLGCCKMLVTVSENDVLRNRGVWYYNAVAESGWQGEVELIEVKGEGHGFHIDHGETVSARNFIKRLACFFHN